MPGYREVNEHFHQISADWLALKILITQARIDDLKEKLDLNKIFEKENFSL